MYAPRIRLFMLAAVFAAVSAVTGFAQAQKEPPTVRDFCVKVIPGKNAEFEAYIHDTAVPLNQSRADAGEIAWFLVVRGVIPAGTSAKCDYRIAYGYKGLPPEPLSDAQIDAALKRAQINLSAKELAAKRDSLSQLVDVGIWSQIEAIGASTEKGNYIRLNHYSVKPGEWENWTHLETTYWKPMVEAWLKSGGKGSWGVYGQMMPEGDNVPYNALTVDIFSDWNSLVHGVPFATWQKVHPNTDATDVFDRLDRVRSRHDIEIYKVLEVTAPAKSN